MSHWYEDHPGMTPADWGRLAYEAYAAHTGWKSLVSGADLPWWDALAEPIREAWAVAAQAVRQCSHGYAHIRVSVPDSEGNKP